MNPNESSMTSLISAFGRAYHNRFDDPKIFDDYKAEAFISDEEFQQISKHMIQGISFFNQDIAHQYQNNPAEILKWVTQVQLSPTPLARAAYCENVLLHEISLGIKQYIILGAGLDTFSLRHTELADTLEIFEIDSPATQQLKQDRLQDCKDEQPGNVRYIPMDFTKNFSASHLADAGVKAEKSFASLLGVSYYLTKEELTDLLKQIFFNLPEGSSIVFDYADENLFTKKGLSNRVENMVKMAEASGEPMKSCYTYEEMEKLLDQAGLLIYEHLSPAEINNLYFKKREDYLTAFETIHFVHAVKK